MSEQTPITTGATQKLDDQVVAGAEIVETDEPSLTISGGMVHVPVSALPSGAVVSVQMTCTVQIVRPEPEPPAPQPQGGKSYINRRAG